MSYEDTFIWMRSWSCIGCHHIFCGRERQCAHCLTPRDPDTFLL